MSNPFTRVRVYFSPQGGTRVEWDISPHFHEPASWTYQLQFAYSATAGESDWIDVGLPVTDVFYLEDDSQRLFGKTLEAYYRIQLVTPVTTYYSLPAGGLSAQDFRDWRISRKILRQEAKRSRYTSVPVPGWLLKERRHGPRCPTCLDALTEQPSDSTCPDCYGIGIDKGYFPAVLCVCDLGLDKGEELQDTQRGTALDQATVCRFAGQPALNSRDVFVSGRSGRRWIVGNVEEGAAIREFVLVEMAELRLLPYSHVIYQVPIG